MKKFNPVYNLFLLMIITSCLIFTSCENKISAPDRVINTPGPVDVSGENNSITVKFYGNNIEEGFIGYNVYVGTVADVEAQGLTPVLNYYGSSPTLIYGSVGCYPNATAKSYITLGQDSFGAVIQPKQTYYVAVAAVVLIDDNEYISSYSSESSYTILYQRSTNIYNQSISGQTNDGCIFQANYQAKVTNVPDSKPNGQTGDMFFKIENIDSQYVPVISVESNNNGIQDLGYANDVNDISSIPTAGYSYNHYVPAIANHIYVLYKASSNQYIKIYITKIDGSYTTLTSDVVLWFEYSY